MFFFKDFFGDFYFIFFIYCVMRVIMSLYVCACTIYVCACVCVGGGYVSVFCLENIL